MQEKFFKVLPVFLLFSSWQVILKGQELPEPKSLKHIVSRHIRSLDFPSASGMGIFFAIAIPIDIPDKSVSLSFYFEANYGLPSFNESTNAANGTTAQFKKRSVDRRLVYDVIWNKLERSGYPGKACLSRAICEAAGFPFERSGLVGDIVRIIFTPSSSLEEPLHPEIEESERASSCSRYREECPISILDLISHSYKSK
ncbi:uncharacterized protein LOC106638598 [Copidosoma floridanum]|uniref:uncharacterized protein LOC106638598 n=1 Tax=Copidosoma floridanum TaxID=29053 RepID=UPI0006C9535F|nr:uncharacterized protein LOC106638598 [Copidosoma floridanum]